MAQFGYMVGMGSVGQQNPLFGGNPAPYGVAQFGLPQGTGGGCGCASPFGQDSMGMGNQQMTQMLQLMQVLMSILGGITGMQGLQGMQGMQGCGGPQMANMFGSPQQCQAPPPPPPPPPPQQQPPRPHHAPHHHAPHHHGPRPQQPPQHHGPPPQHPPQERGPRPSPPPQAPPASRPPHGAPQRQEGRAPQSGAPTGNQTGGTRQAQDPQNAQALQNVRDRIAAKGTDGSCVEYVENQVGHYFPVSEARQMLDDGKHDGYDVVSQPRAGDIFVQTTGQYGHTGIVQSVNRDGTLTVADSNWNLDEKAHVHNIPAGDIQGYLRQQQQAQ